MPVSELEAFIRQNKHLPEVPSARDMEESGLNLKEMNLLLLKKVEELTLYIIEQNKQLEHERAINEKQREDIERLKSKLEPGYELTDE